MFAKVFTQILDSSLANDYQVRHVFEDLLKLADVNGVVDSTIDSIARRTNVPVEIVERAIRELEKPDTSSRTPDHEGRRLLRIDDHRDWGWLIVNYTYYRSLASEEQRRSRTRARVQKYREKTSCNAPVTPCNARNAKRNAFPSTSTSTSASKNGEGVQGKGFTKPTQTEMEMHAQKLALPTTEISRFFDYYESNGWRVGKNPMKSWQSAMNNWKRNYDQSRYINSPVGRASTPNPRNEGICRGVTDYAAAAERRQAKQRELQASLAGQVAGNGSQPPAA